MRKTRLNYSHSIRKWGWAGPLKIECGSQTNGIFHSKKTCKRKFLIFVRKWGWRWRRAKNKHFFRCRHADSFLQTLLTHRILVLLDFSTSERSLTCVLPKNLVYTKKLFIFLLSLLMPLYFSFIVAVTSSHRKTPFIFISTCSGRISRYWGKLLEMLLKKVGYLVCYLHSTSYIMRAHMTEKW